MPAATRVECPVAVDPELALGVYANAFRVLDAGDEQCLLEFLVYSETENRAAIVDRIPVKKSFLPVIRDVITRMMGIEVFDTGTAYSA